MFLIPSKWSWRHASFPSHSTLHTKGWTPSILWQAVQAKPWPHCTVRRNGFQVAIFLLKKKINYRNKVWVCIIFWCLLNTSADPNPNPNYRGFFINAIDIGVGWSQLKLPKSGNDDFKLDFCSCILFFKKFPRKTHFKTRHANQPRVRNTENQSVASHSSSSLSEIPRENFAGIDHFRSWIYFPSLMKWQQT